MRSYYVTFPERLKRQPCPAYPDAHPEGWVTLEAEHEGQARFVAAKEFGRDHFGVYRQIHEADYPRGELGLMRVDDQGVIEYTARLPIDSPRAQ